MGVEKVRALSGGEGSLIDTGGVSMVLLKADPTSVTNIYPKFKLVFSIGHFRQFLGHFCASSDGLALP